MTEQVTDANQKQQATAQQVTGLVRKKSPTSLEALLVQWVWTKC